MPSLRDRDFATMDLTDRDRTAIRSMIEQQLQAFQQNDAVKAFAFASPSIQELFETPENFIGMVQTHYEAVYRPRSVIFEAIAEIEDLPAQTVIFMTSSGNLVRAAYLMQQQPDLSWRIHGCLLMSVDEQFSDLADN